MHSHWIDLKWWSGASTCGAGREMTSSQRALDGQRRMACWQLIRVTCAHSTTTHDMWGKSRPILRSLCMGFKDVANISEASIDQLLSTTLLQSR